MELVYCDTFSIDGKSVLKVITRKGMSFYEYEDITLSPMLSKELLWISEIYLFEKVMRLIKDLNCTKVTVQYLTEKYPKTIELLANELRQEKINKLLGNT